MNAETDVRVAFEGGDEVVVYRLVPNAARELAKVLLRRKDQGWIEDGKDLLQAADDADQYGDAA